MEISEKATIYYSLTDSQLRELCQEIVRETVLKTLEVREEAESLHPSEYWVEKLKIHRSTLWRWEKEGLVTGRRIGKRVFYKFSDFDKVRENV